MRFFGKFTAISALAMASLVGLSVAPQAAIAKENPPKLNLSSSFEKMAKGIVVQAEKDPAAAKSEYLANFDAPVTSDEKLFYAQVGISLLQSLPNDKEIEGIAFSMLGQSGQVDEGKAPGYMQDGAVILYQAESYPLAQKAAMAAYAAGGADERMALVLASSAMKQGGYPAALQLAEQFAAQGFNPGEQFYRIVAKQAQDEGNEAELKRWSLLLAKSNPSSTSWSLALDVAIRSSTLSVDRGYDLAALYVAADGFNTANDYMTVLDMTQNRSGIILYPYDSLIAAEKGVASGALNPSDVYVREVLAGSKAANKDDLAIADGRAAKARSASDSSSAQKAANIYYGNGKYSEAIELYTLAESRPGADLEEIKLRRGISKARLGDYAGAKEDLNALTSGPASQVASYWLAWISTKD